MLRHYEQGFAKDSYSIMELELGELANVRKFAKVGRCRLNR